MSAPSIFYDSGRQNGIERGIYMPVFLILIAVGVLFIILGISILKGNLNAIHEYHRQRVPEAQKAAYGKRMGCGTITCGAGILSFGVMAILSELTAQSAWLTAGSILAVLCLAVGIGILIAATMKYNKGIF